MVVVCLRTFENTCVRQTNILRWNTYVKLREEASIYRMVSLLFPVVSNVLYEYPKLSFWIKWNPDFEKIVKFNNQSNNWLTSVSSIEVKWPVSLVCGWSVNASLKLSHGITRMWAGYNHTWCNSLSWQRYENIQSGNVSLSMTISSWHSQNWRSYVRSSVKATCGPFY